MCRVHASHDVAPNCPANYFGIYRVGFNHIHAVFLSKWFPILEQLIIWSLAVVAVVAMGIITAVAVAQVVAVVWFTEVVKISPQDLTL